MTINDYLRGLSFISLCFAAGFFLFWAITQAPHAVALSHICILLTLLLDRLDRYVEEDR